MIGQCWTRAWEKHEDETFFPRAPKVTRSQSRLSGLNAPNTVRTNERLLPQETLRISKCLLLVLLILKSLKDQCIFMSKSSRQKHHPWRRRWVIKLCQKEKKCLSDVEILERRVHLPISQRLTQGNDAGRRRAFTSHSLMDLLEVSAGH